MSNSEGLHWSFDYNYGAQKPHFTEQLIEHSSDFMRNPKQTESVPRRQSIFTIYFQITGVATR